MNKLLKFKQTDDCKHYFISDLHHFHNPPWTIPLWKARGYDSHIDMNDDQVLQINSMVRPDDVLWHLGDITLNCTETQFEEFLSKIKCQNIYSLFGNHNNPSWAIYQREVRKIIDRDVEIYPLRYKNFVFHGNYQEILIDGQYMVLQHYALTVWNYMKDGAYMIHGHSHGNLPQSLPNESSKGKILDVSWDIFLKPVSFNQINEIMKKKNIITVDHHHN
jgi:calcineurin-like phosphoesterase family protein